VVAVAQVDAYSVPYALSGATTVSGNINGTPVSQAFSTDNDTTFTLLAGEFEGAGAVNSSFSGGSQTLTIQAKNPGTAFSSSLLIT
jgi:hypothetical protein